MITHGFVQIWPFFQPSFLGNIGQEYVFYDILEQKNAFPSYKKKEIEKVKKIDTFPKGLTHGLGPKIAFFPTFLFGHCRPGKCLLRYSRTKKTPFYAIKTRTSKSQKKFTFYQRGSPMVLVQK